MGAAARLASIGDRAFAQAARVDNRKIAPPAHSFECLALAGVVDRHAEAVRLAQAWPSSDPPAAAALIAVRTVGSELRPPEAGYIIFPDVSALPGPEWSRRPRPPDAAVEVAGPGRTRTALCPAGAP